MEYCIKVDSYIHPNTQLYVNTNAIERYRLEINGKSQIKYINNQNGQLLPCVIKLINTIGIPQISLYEYNQLKEHNSRYILDLMKCLYPTDFIYEIFNGKQYGYYDGQPSKLKLELVALWPWSLKNYSNRLGTYKIKKIVLSSSVTREFMCSLESYMISTDDKKISFTENITIDNIELYIKFIVATYIFEMIFFETLEGRVFNGGSVDWIDKIIEKGCLKVII